MLNLQALDNSALNFKEILVLHNNLIIISNNQIL